MPETSGASRDMGRTPFAIAGLVAGILATGYFVFEFVTHWNIGFSSDTALLGLMAKWIAEKGELPIFVWTVGYQGVFLDAYLAALLFKVFGISPVVLSLAPTIYYLLGLSIWTVVVYRAAGLTAAMVGLLVTSCSIPSLYILNLRTLPNFAESFFIGSLILCTAQSILHDVESSGSTKPWKVLALGMFAGFGVYTFAVTGYYIIAVLSWAALYVVGKRSLVAEPSWRNWIWPVSDRSPGLLWLSRVLAGLAWFLMIVGLMTFFDTPDSFMWQGREIFWRPDRLLTYGLETLFVLNLVRSFSEKRRLGFGVRLVLGALIGYAPTIYHRLVLEGASSKTIAIVRSWEAISNRSDHLGSFLGWLFHSASPLSIATVGFSIMVIVYAFASALLSWVRFASGRSRFDQRVAFPLLFMIVVSIFLVSQMVVDIESTRYAIFLVSVFAAMVGIFVSDSWSLSRTTGWLSVMACAVLVFAGATDVRQVLIDPPKNRRFDVSLYQTVQTEMAERGLQYGYADYWIAYAVNFLSNESIILEPAFSNYCPHYRPMVEAAEKLAYFDFGAGHGVDEIDDTMVIHGRRFSVVDKKKIGHLRFFQLARTEE